MDRAANRLIERFYYFSDGTVGRMEEAGCPTWLCVTVGYLLGQHVWTWLISKH